MRQCSIQRFLASWSAPFSLLIGPDVAGGLCTAACGMTSLCRFLRRIVIKVSPKGHLDLHNIWISFSTAGQIQDLPTSLRRSVTFDNGKEFAEHAMLTGGLRLEDYFADPNASWQRGANENMNGLLRQYFPKDTDFTQISHRKVTRVEQLLNERCDSPPLSESGGLSHSTSVSEVVPCSQGTDQPCGQCRKSQSMTCGRKDCA